MDAPHGEESPRHSRRSRAVSDLVVAAILTPIATLSLLWLPTASGSAAGLPVERGSGGLYVALGESLAAGVGASSTATSYVGLLFTHYQTTLGVTELSNRAVGGASSTTLLNDGQLSSALGDINQPSDTRAVTIGIGGNDGQFGCSLAWDTATCPYRANLAQTLARLAAALEADPGAETFIEMAYYNPRSGTGGPLEAQTDTGLLGANLRIACPDRGPDAGLNDVIFQEAGRHEIGVADAYPAFKSGGQSLIADGVHANDAGHAAIAAAFRSPVPSCTDTDPPETTVTGGPRRRTAKHSARFVFGSDEGAAFACSIDGQSFVTCDSPKMYRDLARGRHRFRVRATDEAGNTDATPARWRWTVKR